MYADLQFLSKHRFVRKSWIKNLLQNIVHTWLAIVHVILLRDSYDKFKKSFNELRHFIWYKEILIIIIFQQFVGR